MPPSSVSLILEEPLASDCEACPCQADARPPGPSRAALMEQCVAAVEHGVDASLVHRQSLVYERNGIPTTRHVMARSGGAAVAPSAVARMMREGGKTMMEAAARCVLGATKAL